MRKNSVEPDRPQMKIRRMRIACWIPEAINTHTQNMWYALLFHWNSGCTNASHSYGVRTLVVLLLQQTNVCTQAGLQ